MMPFLLLGTRAASNSHTRSKRVLKARYKCTYKLAESVCPRLARRHQGINLLRVYCSGGLPMALLESERQDIRLPIGPRGYAHQGIRCLWRRDRFDTWLPGP